jgi:hypothetical protein
MTITTKITPSAITKTSIGEPFGFCDFESGDSLFVPERAHLIGGAGFNAHLAYWHIKRLTEALSHLINMLTESRFLGNDRGVDIVHREAVLPPSLFFSLNPKIPIIASTIIAFTNHSSMILPPLNSLVIHLSFI